MSLYLCICLCCIDNVLFFTKFLFRIFYFYIHTLHAGDRHDGQTDTYIRTHIYLCIGSVVCWGEGERGEYHRVLSHLWSRGEGGREGEGLFVEVIYCELEIFFISI